MHSDDFQNNGFRSDAARALGTRMILKLARDHFGDIQKALRMF